MKYIKISQFLFFNCLLTLSLDGQEIKFRVYEYDTCNDSYEIYLFYTLKGNNEILIPLDTTGIIIIPSPGEYFFQTDIGLKSVKLIEEKVYSDTLRKERVYLCHTPSTNLTFSGFCCCDELCNGYQVDYYSNNNKSIEGFFKDGEAIGNVYFYHPNGNLKLVQKYTKNGSGVIIKEISYDEQGNKLDVIRYGKWYYFLICLFRK